MRVFILFCLTGAALADSLGYNYHPLGDSLDGLSFTLGAFPIANTIPNTNLPLPNLSEVNGPTYANREENPYQQSHSQTAAQQPSLPQSPETEFFTYTAPENHPDPRALQNLAGILRPQRVLFIRTPETNIFTMTAEQLARQNSLDIYVLSRQTNRDSLSEQFKEIQELRGHKPLVHFVKYRTPEDLEQAKQAIRYDYESLPGPSTSYNEGEAPVIDLSSPSSVTPAIDLRSSSDSVSASESPVIFKISSRASAGYQTYEAVDEAPREKYLPPQ